METDPKAYVAMLEDLDSDVGKLLKTLDQLGIADNTIVIFVSDNGGFAGAANMGPLSGSKGTTLEGGIRVPLIIRWPQRIKPNTTSDQVCVTFDLTNSLLTLAGADIKSVELDGIDIIRHVADGRDDMSRSLFWRGRRGDRTWSAVRDGDLKFVRKQQAGKTEQWMYDLANDIGEQDDLASKRMGEAKRLQKLLERWETEVTATR